MKTFGTVRDQGGFTLIEIIAVLVLIGILAGVLGIGLTTGVRGYLLAAENTAISQKAQLAMTRLGREIQECFDCDGNNTYPANLAADSFTYENHLGYRSLDLDTADNTLLLNGETLTDQVSSFTLVRESDGRITIELEISHEQGGVDITFRNSILPRNI